MYRPPRGPVYTGPNQVNVLLKLRQFAALALPGALRTARARDRPRIGTASTVGQRQGHPLSRGIRQPTSGNSYVLLDGSRERVYWEISHLYGPTVNLLNLHKSLPARRDRRSVDPIFQKSRQWRGKADGR